MKLHKSVVPVILLPSSLIMMFVFGRRKISEVIVAFFHGVFWKGRFTAQSKKLTSIL